MTNLTSRLIPDENHVLSNRSQDGCPASWVLCESETEEFSVWIDQQLVQLERQFKEFVTPNSLKHSLRR